MILISGHISVIPIYKLLTIYNLGIVFTSGGSFSEAQATPSGQAQKAIFAMNRYLNKFVNVTPSHSLELFDKLIAPILNYASEI